MQDQLEEQLRTDRRRDVFTISISDETFNFTEHKIADRKVTGGQVAGLAGAHPVTDYVILQHLTSGELETLRPTETTDLAAKGVERFFVIRGDETFRFTVEGLSMEWPRQTILGKNVKFLGRIDAHAVLVLRRPDGDRVVHDNDAVSLSGEGVEEFIVRKFVTVIYNHDQKFELEPRIYTTEELLGIFKVPSGYKLDLVPKDAPFHELAPGEKIRIAEGMEFVSHPPRGQSS